MEQIARARGGPVSPDAAPILSEDLVVWEILVRLPAKTLLRCRAVCRSWRQPSLPLIYFRTQKGEPGVFNGALDAVDIWRSPLERRPVLRFNDDCPYKVEASCDGLLVLRFRTTRFYYICNPTTCQSIQLSHLMLANVLALYPHGSSDDYRILCWNYRRYNDGNIVYTCYVFTVGYSMTPRDVENHWASELRYVRRGSSVLLHGCLHWVHRGGKILVFDTVGESFRWMSAPTDDDNWTDSQLFQINGTLGISISQINSSSKTMINLWILKNYEAEVWLMKYQI